MTTLLFIRHGAHELLGRTLAGRDQEVHINALGARQAQWLGERLKGLTVNAIFSSPLARCVETATVISQRIGLPVEILEAANEIDFGDWSGRDFADLDPLSEWKVFNALRSLHAPPGGEYLVQVQARMLSIFAEWGRRYSQKNVALVSHADVIKASVAYFLGVPIDLFHRIEISPGSLTAVRLDAEGPRILLMNETLPA